MLREPAFNSQQSATLFRSIFLTGLLAGTLDILSAFLHAWLASGVTPGVVLQYIASGVFGSKAFAGGSVMMVLGLCIHFIIAYSFTTLYFWLYPRLPVLRRTPWLSGIGYGLCIWLVMNLLVLPLTQVKQAPFRPLHAAIGAGILILAIGIPVAWRAHRQYTKAG